MVTVPPSWETAAENENGLAGVILLLGLRTMVHLLPICAVWWPCVTAAVPLLAPSLAVVWDSLLATRR